MEKPADRAIVPVFAMDKVQQAGDREIRMRPVPLILQGRPKKEEARDV